MNVLQMSVSGAVLILAVAAVRAVTIHRLPKKTFLILWWIVLARLLIPFSVPSVWSVYSIFAPDTYADVRPNPSTITVPAFPTAADTDTSNRLEQTMAVPESALSSQDITSKDTIGSPDISGFPSMAETRKFIFLFTHTDGFPAVTGSPRPSPKNIGYIMYSLKNFTAAFPWSVVWIIGTLLCAACFTAAYLRCRFEFRMSLPVQNDFAEQWLAGHSAPLRIKKRRISIRQSDRVSTPLTYGIFHPVILMPKKTDWEDTAQLQYILLHEYIHIRRFDAAAKLAAALALCVHWFNPLVWAMYFLFQRDIELSCDEEVVRRSGKTSKSSYALVLINMEAKKSGLMPFCNGFGRNAMKERITSIMKMKKTSLTAIVTAVLLITVITATLVTSAAKPPESKPQENGDIANPGVTKTPDDTENTPDQDSAGVLNPDTSENNDNAGNNSNYDNSDSLHPDSPENNNNTDNNSNHDDSDSLHPDTPENNDNAGNNSNHGNSDSLHPDAPENNDNAGNYLNHNSQDIFNPDTPENQELYSFPVQVSDGRELTVVLASGKPWENYFSVEQILVYEGDLLLQTIETASVPVPENYAWDGLFVNQGYEMGEPDIRDLNFDGAEDFGLLSVAAYSINLPYSYFLWNNTENRFDYGFTLIGSKELEIDIENQRLIEHSHDILGQYADFYGYAPDGTLEHIENPESGNAFVEDYSYDITTFTYGGKTYDMSERNSAVTAIMDCFPVGSYLIVLGHTGPKHAIYSIFNTVTREFEKDIIGSNLIFRNNDIRTVLYTFWNEVYTYDGTVAASYDMGRYDFIRELSFSEDGKEVTVTIAQNDSDDYRTETFRLER